MTMLDHWQLRHNPFAPQTRHEDWFLADRGEEAFARLLFVVEQGRRLAAVTGGPNLGKSRLLREVAQAAKRPHWQALFVDASGVSRRDLAQELARAGGFQPNSEREAWDRLTDLFFGWQVMGQTCLWLIDHFDRATEELDLVVLRLLRLLERTQAQGTILIAARELNPTCPIADALDLSVVLEPWTYRECQEFVRRQLAAAGDRSAVFTNDGLEALAQASGGVPGTLMRLGDLCLHAGWSLGVDAISAELVDDVATELGSITASPSHRDHVFTE